MGAVLGGLAASAVRELHAIRRRALAAGAPRAVLVSGAAGSDAVVDVAEIAGTLTPDAGEILARLCDIFIDGYHDLPDPSARAAFAARLRALAQDLEHPKEINTTNNGGDVTSPVVYKIEADDVPEVSVYRADDGWWVVGVDTATIGPEDHLDSGGSPRMRMWCNDALVMDGSRFVDHSRG